MFEVVNFVAATRRWYRQGLRLREMQENATPAKYQSMGNGLDAVPRSCLYDKTALPVWCRKGGFSM